MKKLQDTSLDSGPDLLPSEKIEINVINPVESPKREKKIPTAQMSFASVRDYLKQEHNSHRSSMLSVVGDESTPEQFDLPEGEEEEDQNDQLNAFRSKVMRAGGNDLSKKDKNGHNDIHRAALAQQIAPLETLWQKEENKPFFDDPDKYGNTPLTLCCIRENNRARLECVKFLVSLEFKGMRRCRTSNTNLRTLWSPVHWVCYYGDILSLRVLLERKGETKLYLPDSSGLFPLDIAGLRRKKRIIMPIIDALLEEIVPMSKWKTEKFENQFIANPDIMFLLSPHLHTWMLYWLYSSTAERQELSLKSKEIKKLSALVQAPIEFEKMRSPLHAVALTGEQLLLNELLEQFIETHTFPSIEEGDNYFYRKDRNCYANLVSVLNKYPKKVKSQFLEFLELVRKISLSKTDQRSLDVKDINQNTPLHMAAAMGFNNIYERLEYLDCDENVRNIDGWRPRDYLAHFNNKEIYDFPQSSVLPVTMTLRPNSPPNQIHHSYDDYMSSHGDAKEKELKQSSKGLPTANYSSIDYVKEASIVRERGKMNATVALRLSTKKREVFNVLVRTLIDFKFVVGIFKPVLQKDQVVLLLEPSLEIVEKEAQNLKILMREKVSLEFEPFTVVKRKQFEPFRSKDIQRISLEYIQDYIDFHMLTSQKVLQGVALLHDRDELQRIKHTWMKQKCKVPLPFGMLGRLFREGENINYPEFTCIRNYFGEMRAFYYAWVSFYTAWLCIPIIPGILFMIYRYVALRLHSSEFARDAPFPFFAIFMCLWGSIAVSRWRRKQSEIATKWGLVSQLDNPIREKRVEFSGDYYIDTDSFHLKRYTHKKQRCLLLLLTVPVLIVLLSISIGIYLIIQEYKQRYQGFVIQLSFGVLNGVGITIINLIYQRIAIWSTERENYQFLSSFERVLVFKSFLFKFINSNMSLAYAAYFEANFDSLWYLVVGLLLARMANLFLLGNILPWMLFWLKRKRYFRMLRVLIEDRQLLNPSTRKIHPSSRDKTSSFTSFEKDVLRRVVYDFNHNQLLSKTPIDSIEMDTNMNKAQLVIHRYAELMVQFGYITMYSAVCPVASLLGLFAGMLELKYGIIFDAKYLQRNVATKSTGIGTWMVIWEFLSILSILATFLLSYIVFPLLQDEFDDSVGFLFLLVLIEHILVLLRGVIVGGQKSKAAWVAHLAERKSQEESESKKMQEVINQRRIQHLHHKLQTEKMKKNKEEVTVKHLSADLEKKEQLLEDKDLKIQKLQAQIKVENQSKRMSLLYQEPVSPVQEYRASRFSSIKKVSPYRQAIQEVKTPSVKTDSTDEDESSAHDLIKNQALLEAAYLNYQSDPSDVSALLLETLALKLVDITANRIESELKTHRLGIVTACLSTKQDLLVLCSLCCSAPASSRCQECLDFFCEKCFDDIHLQTRLLHQKVGLSVKVFPSFNFLSQNTLTKLPKIDESFKGMKPKKKMQTVVSDFEPLKQQWLKFQYFSFPTHRDAPHFKEMEAYFAYLFQEYVSKNFIRLKREEGRVLDLETFLIHPCRTVLLTETMAQALDLKLFETTQLEPIGFSHLNDEEKLFLNRIMHKLLRSALSYSRDIFYGTEKDQNEKYEIGAGRSISNRRNATFSEFMKDVKKLQHGTFEQKLLLFCNLVDEESGGVIEREKLSSFLNTLMLQNVSPSENKFYMSETRLGKQGVEHVVSLIFEGKYNRMEKSELFQQILAEERAMDLLKVALQDL